MSSADTTTAEQLGDARAVKWLTNAPDIAPQRRPLVARLILKQYGELTKYVDSHRHVFAWHGVEQSFHSTQIDNQFSGRLA